MMVHPSHEQSVAEKFTDVDECVAHNRSLSLVPDLWNLIYIYLCIMIETQGNSIY